MNKPTVQARAFDPATARYVLLATRRRDGREVPTPVWIAASDDRYYVFSAGDAGKVKRVRHTPAVRLALCTARGRALSAWREGSARLVGDERTLEIAYRALHAKYGWAMWIADVLAKATGRYSKRAMIEILL